VNSESAEETQRRLNRILDYEIYLQSAVWREKRGKVMERCGCICEGCGNRRAVQVHHVRYPRGCAPGSRRWVALEKLWDLVAVCGECHREVHWGWEPVE
jgi:hypothetical protein